MSTLVWARVPVSAPPPSSLSSGTGWASPPSTWAPATPRSWPASRPAMQVTHTPRSAPHEEASQYFSGDFLHPTSPADLRLGGDLERDISKTSASVGHRPGGLNISDNTYISILCNRFSTGIASKLVLINNFVYTFHADSRNSQVIFLICIVL